MGLIPEIMTEEFARDMGAYFGYPQCCIDWFVQERVNKHPNFPPMTTQQEQVHKGNGFIPCPTCAEKVTHETIGSLVQGRKCSISYGNIDLATAVLLKLIGL